MDGQMAASFLKLIIFLPLVVLLAYVSLKLGGSKMMGLRGGRIIRIVERVPLSAKSFLCVALIDDKPYVISSTEEKIEILLELPTESIEKINSKDSFKENLVTNFNQLLNRKDRL